MYQYLVAKEPPQGFLGRLLFCVYLDNNVSLVYSLAFVPSQRRSFPLAARAPSTSRDPHPKQLSPRAALQEDNMQDTWSLYRALHRDFARAELAGVDLTNNNLSDTTFEGANLTDAD